MRDERRRNAFRTRSRLDDARLRGFTVVHLAVSRDGLELPYVEQGDPDGVPAVLLHGWLDSLRCFDQLMAVMPQRIRVLAFDQRGHGDAAKPADGYELGDFADDVGAFLDAIGLDAAVLVGASSGGYVAQRFAVDDPGRTLGLALLGSPRSLRGERPRFADVLATLEDPIDAAFVRELNEGMIARDVPEVVMATLCEENLKVPARVWRDAFEGLVTAEPPLDTGRISAPTLVVWGARDSLLPRADQEAMAAEIPDARLVMYEDVGHLPIIEAPEHVAADLTALCDALAAQ
jgi:pimeloyl-ACP methyl ester carboxylesterase